MAVPGITQLPCEIINTVLRHLGSLQDLASALLTCRLFHTSFQENPHIAIDILQQQIAPALLPYAVAVMEASRIDTRMPQPVQALLDKLQDEIYLESQTKSATMTSHASLNEVLTELYDDDGDDDDTPLHDYADKETAALFLPSEPRHDADKGPFEAWWIANKELRFHDTLMHSNNAGFRERAYVLWDKDRLQRYTLLELFAQLAPESELELQNSAPEQAAMRESFEARSKIWEKGGSGYWSKGDESRIVWNTG
ncbi:uncharacterized protein SPSK_10526 [Sporothrix schenckii 1099-18]|uniref:F-box domain-containing protein n=1 Tax=Sporothrix schenckii 1099-18 TaxID=1397361 RepID=A0A0F2LYP2_SPOSC|nr:uncharacterized protein SPSK_10526 [Sporothrix schenckii 1099-18]KJR81949.1 hypothetical protein SPSK_10526 [Sporothrix schenckii 1099-18]